VAISDVRRSMTNAAVLTISDSVSARLVFLEADDAAIVRWVSEKVLESYRNGITAGQKGAQVIRHGQSRRRGTNQALY